MCESRPPALRRVCRIKKRLTRGCRKRSESPQRHGNRSCSNQSAPPVFHWYQYTPTPRHKSNNFPISGNYFPQRTSAASYPHTPPIHRRGEQCSPAIIHIPLQPAGPGLCSARDNPQPSEKTTGVLPSPYAPPIYRRGGALLRPHSIETIYQKRRANCVRPYNSL